MFLTAADIERLTEKKRFTAQCRALDRMKISYTRSASGAPLVRSDTLDSKRAKPPKWEPDWQKIGL